MSGSGSGSKLSALVITSAAYLSFATRLSVIITIAERGTSEQTCAFSVEQSLDTFSRSFFLQCSVFINFDGVQSYFNLGSSVGGDELSLGRDKDGSIASRDDRQVGDADGLSI